MVVWRVTDGDRLDPEATDGTGEERFFATEKAARDSIAERVTKRTDGEIVEKQLDESYFDVRYVAPLTEFRWTLEAIDVAA